MEEETEELINQLISANDLEEFTYRNRNAFETLTLKEYLIELLQKYNKTKIDIIKESGLDITYGYQIFDGRKKPKREKLLQLAFGFSLSLPETNRLLRIGGMNELYVRKKRDAILIYCLQRKLSLQECNTYLYNMGEDTVPIDG